ncbi:MFS transporter [Chelatococcus reniformis]|uniref:MFS transporter n=2 Tax=Chelatococcus reniformis TaxID=1494448 RepID=A0A916UQH6_9HYPH|nr:MFS transporter [Chelatococcus reniformis]
MLEKLDESSHLTANQWKLVSAAAFGIMLEFLDYFLIGFILTFVVGPWKLTFGESSVVLLSSGIGAMLGAVYFGWLADRIGRRKVFLLTIGIFTISTGALIFTPDEKDAGLLYLTAFRFLIGFGAGGLYCVDLPMVQEFMPARKRGIIAGLVTAGVPVGFLIGAGLVAFVAPMIGWRGLMGVCVILSLVTLLIRSWIPESPRWLLKQGEPWKARESVAWALQVEPTRLPLTSDIVAAGAHARFADLLRYPRSLALSWITNLGGQTGYYGLALWSPTLIVKFLNVRPDQAAFYMIFVMLAALAGRIALSILSERIGRRMAGTICSAAAVVTLLAAALAGDTVAGSTGVFLLILMGAYFFGEGLFAIVGPYSAEVWPSSLRTTGMGSAYGFGGLGKIVGPLGLALVVGASVTPSASNVSLLTAFSYFASWYALAGLAFLLIGIETKGQSIEAIEHRLGRHEGTDPVGVGGSGEGHGGTARATQRQ